MTDTPEQIAAFVKWEEHVKETVEKQKTLLIDSLKAEDFTDLSPEVSEAVRALTAMVGAVTLTLGLKTQMLMSGIVAALPADKREDVVERMTRMEASIDALTATFMDELGL